MTNPDRLSIAEKDRDFINNKVKKTNFLNFAEARNKEIFLFALALGIDNPTEFEGRKDGYLLEKDLHPLDVALIYAAVIASIHDNELISDKNYIYDYVQKCANTGFRIIDDCIESESPENIDKHLLLELDNKYQNLFPE